MSSRRLDPPLFVHDQSTFAQMMAHLGTQCVLAVDTESDSLYSYYPKVCLLQISTYADPHRDPTRVSDFLVDTLRFRALEPLRELLACADCESIMHAAQNDILLLQQEFAFGFGHIFDTQLAARILGWKRVGLDAILEQHFGVTTNKRMQRTNWGQRPLTPQQIAYAQTDTHYLLALRQLQMDRLAEAGRLEEAQEAFGHLADVDYRDRSPAERSLWQMKESRHIARDLTGVLESLWLWREKLAQRRDSPPFKILKNHVLAELAERQPSNMAELGDTPGLNNGEIRRYGQQILNAIAEGRDHPLPELPEPHGRPELLLDPSLQARYDTLRSWRTRVAENRGVAPDIVLTNDTLLEIARSSPSSQNELLDIREIGPWKARTYGPAILEIVAD